MATIVRLMAVVLAHTLNTQGVYSVDISQVNETESHNPFSGTFYLNSCHCDRITNICEPNCCCDADCVSENGNKCSKYIKQTFNDAKYICNRSAVIEEINMETMRHYFAVGPRAASMFCASSENLADIVRYYSDETLWSETTQVSLLMNENDNAKMVDMLAYSTDVNSNVIVPSGFNLTLIGLNGYMNDCGTLSSISTYSSSFTCYIKLAALADSCSSTSMIDAKSVYQAAAKFKYADNEVNVPVSLAGVYLSKADSFSNVQTISSPTYTSGSATCTCSNVLRSITYNLYYTDNFTFTSIAVELHLANISKTCGEVSEHHINVNYRYYNTTQYPTINTKVLEDSSGNPGYQFNRPLKAASISQSNIKVYKDYIPLVGLSDINTTCPTSTGDKLVIPIIKFGQNISSGCITPAKLTSATCKDINTSILSLQVVNTLADVYFARVGRPNMDKLENWISVPKLAASDISAAVYANGVCSGVISAISIVFIYEQAGDRLGYYISNIKKTVAYRDISIATTSVSLTHVLKLNVEFEPEDESLRGNSKINYVKDKFNKLFFAFSHTSALATASIILYVLMIGN